MPGKHCRAVGLLAAACALCLAVSASAAAPLRGYTGAEGYQYIALGRVPQGAAGEEAPILWRVLAVEEGHAYLLSEYVLAARQVHHAWETYGEWVETDLYAYLNGSFLRQAFTPAEQALLRVSVSPGTVFIPSLKDLQTGEYGFRRGADRQGRATPYGMANGLFTYMRGEHYAPYWTRSRSDAQPGSTRRTMSGGALGYIRAIVSDLGFRPGVYLVMDGLPELTGAGTQADPLRLEGEEGERAP